MTGQQKKLWKGLFALALLAPLGIILPEIFRAGGAWGEWTPEQLQRLAGYAPEGLKKLSELWKAPIPDYGSGAASPAVRILSYIASGLVGILAIGFVIYLISKVVTRNGK